jgi:hypothetical protein
MEVGFDLSRSAVQRLVELAAHENIEYQIEADEEVMRAALQGRTLSRTLLLSIFAAHETEVVKTMHSATVMRLAKERRGGRRF